MITILFFFWGGGGGKLGILGEEASTPQIPEIEPFREVSDLLSRLYQVLWKIPYHQASFVSKTLRICPLWAWIFFSTVVPWEFTYAQLGNFSTSKRVKKGHCIWEYILWKSRSLQNTEATLCLSFSLTNERKQSCLYWMHLCSIFIVSPAVKMFSHLAQGARPVDCW